MKEETIFQIRERLCKGCNSSIDIDIDNKHSCAVCIKPINDHGETCPCSNCLIKMICVESCLEFRDYCRR